MELKITESNSYFDKLASIPENPTKKVSFNDILASLKMTVVNGKLEIMRTDNATKQKPVKSSLKQQSNYPVQQQLKQRHQQQQQQQQQQPYKQQYQYQPKQYQQQQPLEEIPILTPEEYRKQEIISKVNAYNEQVRNRLMKSKKLNFSSTNIITTMNAPVFKLALKRE
jgi:hypothetical protein